MCDSEDWIEQEDLGEVSEGNNSNMYTNRCLEEIFGEIRRAKVNLTIGNSTRGSTIVWLDTAAEVSLFRSRELVWDVKEAETPLRIEGVGGGDKVVVGTVGSSIFGEVYYSTKVPGNILSFGEIIDNGCVVQYLAIEDTFIVTTLKRDVTYSFKRVSGEANIYICNLEVDVIVCVETVFGNEQKYSKRDVERAKLARKYCERMHYITDGALAKMLRNNKIRNAEIGVADIARAMDIYGKSIGSLKGKSVRNKTTSYDKEYDVVIHDKMMKEEQILYVDILFVEEVMFIYCKTSPPLSYRCIRKIEGRKSSDIFTSLSKVISHLGRTGITITALRMDEESGLKGDAGDMLAQQFNVEVDLSAGGQAVGVIERDIRTLKERVRCIYNTLPYMLDEVLEKWLLSSTVYYLNWGVSVSSMSNNSANEILMNRQLDADIELKFAYGDYVQLGAYETDNTMKERTRGAIALMPTGNADGSWHFLVLSTWRKVTRTSATVTPIPDEVIQYLNLKAVESKKRRGIKAAKLIRVGKWNPLGYEPGYFDDKDDVEEAKVVEEVELDNLDDYKTKFIDPPIEGEFKTFELEDEEEETIESNIKDDVADVKIDDSNPMEQSEPGQSEPHVEENLRYSLRGNRSQPGRWKGVHVARKSASVFNMTIKTAINKLGYEAIKSIVNEMTGLHDRGTFEPVDWDNRVITLSEKDTYGVAKRLPSSMFLKDKYTPQGDFDKLKARLVAGGHMQDRIIFDNGGSPTATTTSVFIIANIAAIEGRAVGTIDFPGAFVLADMPEDGRPVYVKLNKFESSVLVRIDPIYEKYLDNYGCLTVKLKKALYGCIESARIWYEKISSDFERMGYKKNGVDMCVFNRIENDNTQSTILIHVDDCLITARNEENLSNIIKEIEGRYKELTIKRGRVIDYLGMRMEFQELFKSGNVKITMNGYIKELLEFTKNIKGIANTPASDKLFKVSKESNLLGEKEKDFFHSVVAKCLYLAKRVRPDILTAVSFLVKRVTRSTREDMDKLERLIKYIRDTKYLGIKLEGGKNLGVYAYIDASYAVHEDYKSHSGCVIGIGRGPVYANSKTQKLNTKSSSEAELIGISDNSNQVIWSREFVKEQGYNVDPAVIYEDNTSTINMVKNGRSNSERTRHIAIRFYFIADRVNAKEIRVEYKRSEDMIADILTKPLQGKQFYNLREQLLNWTEADTTSNMEFAQRPLANSGGVLEKLYLDPNDKRL